MKKLEFDKITDVGGRLTAYIHEPDSPKVHRGTRPGILVIPGGGYQSIVEREEDPVAFEFFASGFHVFVLEYSVWHEGGEALGLKPLIQASAAMLLIREHAAEWNLAPDKLAVLGFSAGGHLAGACATLWDSPELRAAMDTQGGKNRPDAAVLCYPVVVMEGEIAHPGSIMRLCGEESRYQKLYSLPEQVGEKTPPMFLWSTMEDQLVQVENTLCMAQALQRNHVPYELHIYQKGRHGLTLGKWETNESHPHLASWVRLCKEWLGEQLQFDVSI